MDHYWQTGLTIAGAMALQPVIALFFNTLHRKLSERPESALCRLLLWKWK